MKALLITNDFPPMVGGEAAWYGRVCATVPPDHVTVLAPHMRGDRAFDAVQAYRVFRAWVPTKPHLPARLAQLLVLFLRAARIMRQERIDATHIGHLYLSPIGLALKRLFNTPYVVYLHGGEMAPYLRFRAVRRVVRALVHHAGLVVANSTYTQRQYEAMGIHHPHTEVLTIGVDIERFRPDLDVRRTRARYGLDGAKVVLTVGRLIERKGHDVVIRALSRIRQAVGPVRYLIAGRGPEEERLRGLARDLGCLEDVIFAGEVPDDDLPALYAACDVFAMPSRALAQRDGVEGFGIVFLEAGACGKPVIGGRSGGIADAVIDGVTGVLVDPTNVEELVGVLTRLLLHPREAAQLGMAGRVRAERLASAWGEGISRVWEMASREEQGRLPGGERTRVLHVITRLVVGGAQENTLLTTSRLDRARYHITLASGPATGPEGNLEDQIPKDIVFERIPELIRAPHPIKDILALWRLYALMRRDRYHIVHTHTTKAGMLGRIAARLARVPIVVHTPHGHAFHDYLNSAGAEALKWVERGLARWTDRIICLTEAERQDHLRFRIGGPDRFEVIHSGVDIDRFREARVVPEAKRQALGLPAAGPLVGCVARLVPVKGVHYLLEAVPTIRAAVPNTTVVFVGDGPLRADLERRAAALGLDGAIAFLGLRQDVAEIMRLCDVVVLPSLNEGMGRVAVEALATGRPVIGSRVGGIQDVIADGETGFLVPPADPAALARAVIRCLADRALSRAMGERAQQVIEAYGVEPMITRIDRLYSWLLGSLFRMNE